MDSYQVEEREQIVQTGAPTPRALVAERPPKPRPPAGVARMTSTSNSATSISVIKYAARRAAKRGIYTKYNLRLIELDDADIERLDDVLPRMLLKFGIESA